MVLPFIPASNLFFPVGFVIAERVLYMPSMGFCMLIACGFQLLNEKQNRKVIAWLLMFVLIGSHAIKTYHRNWDWKSEYSIFMSGLRVNQRNAKLFNNVGHALESDGRYNEALSYFLAAVQVQADDVGAHINVGRTYNHLKEFQKAEEAFLRAKSLLPKAKPGESYQARIAPNHLNVFLNLANLISKNHTRLEEADLLYRQAISMRSDYTQAYINRGDILIKLNRTKDAQEVYERALLYDSTNPDIYYNVCMDTDFSFRSTVFTYCPFRSRLFVNHSAPHATSFCPARCARERSHCNSETKRSGIRNRLNNVRRNIVSLAGLFFLPNQRPRMKRHEWRKGGKQNLNRIQYHSISVHLSHRLLLERKRKAGPNERL